MMGAIPDLWKSVSVLFPFKAAPPSTRLVTGEHHGTSCSGGFLLTSGTARNVTSEVSQPGLAVGGRSTLAAAPESGNKF